MALKLHGIPMSTCTTRVLTCLHEKGLDFELVPVNLFAGEHKQPPFLAKNPFGQIPVLEDGDFTLFESRAITAYLAEKYKETGCDLLRHNDLKEAALVKVWLEVESQHYYPAIYQIVYQFFALPLQGKTADQAIIDVNLEKLGKTPWASLINSRPNVKAWWEDISSRPAFKKVAEGMTFGEK
ncbi:Glutathione S-transferase F13 [Vitis vinifera]|uniref:glutathione transferase n=1 Tax=Vitis vinifera TaxID=29760 RepID=A0A438KH34_VITVI|nr:Glutathione S-transferase F13 [Vitis vinifera]